MTPRIIVGVPGPWPDYRALTQAIAQAHTGYIAAGLVMMEIGGAMGFAIDFYPHDPKLRSAFRAAGGGLFSEDQLDIIAGHQTTAYLLCDRSSQDAAKAIARAAVAILDAGGLGVKVESTGVAHPPEAWRALTASDKPRDLYRLFVVVVSGIDGSYSCGMHNFGLPDAQAGPEIPAKEAGYLFDVLNLYQLTESPKIADGHTFATAPNEPMYRLHWSPCEGFPEGDPFHNPHGMWKIEPAAPRIEPETA